MATAGRRQPGQGGASHLGPGRARVDKTSSLIREKPAGYPARNPGRRGSLRKSDVQLNRADGFSAPTPCQCDYVYCLERAKLHSGQGQVSWERQQQIKSVSAVKCMVAGDEQGRREDGKEMRQ